MNKIAINEIRPWEQPFWRPARDKGGGFLLSSLDLRKPSELFGLAIAQEAQAEAEAPIVAGKHLA